jgi:hypothetical protein
MEPVVEETVVEPIVEPVVEIVEQPLVETIVDNNEILINEVTKLSFNSESQEWVLEKNSGDYWVHVATFSEKQYALDWIEANGL